MTQDNRQRDEQPETSESEVTIPIAQEELAVGKTVKPAGSVVVHVDPEIRRETVEMALGEEHVEVIRVPINRPVDGPTPTRREGDVTIVPVFEEVLVVEKKLFLVTLWRCSWANTDGACGAFPKKKFTFAQSARFVARRRKSRCEPNTCGCCAPMSDHFACDRHSAGQRVCGRHVRERACRRPALRPA